MSEDQKFLDFYLEMKEVAASGDIDCLLGALDDFFKTIDSQEDLTEESKNKITRFIMNNVGCAIASVSYHSCGVKSKVTISYGFEDGFWRIYTHCPECDTWVNLYKSGKVEYTIQAARERAELSLAYTAKMMNKTLVEWKFVENYEVDMAYDEGWYFGSLVKMSLEDICWVDPQEKLKIRKRVGNDKPLQIVFGKEENHSAANTTAFDK
jgi:hypothetical protein